MMKLLTSLFKHTNKLAKKRGKEILFSFDREVPYDDNAAPHNRYAVVPNGPSNLQMFELYQRDGSHYDPYNQVTWMIPIVEE